MEAGQSPPVDIMGSEESPSVVSRIVKVLTYLFLAGATTMGMVVASILPVANSFSSHIYLCGFGYIILMGVGITACDVNACWSGTVQLQKKKLCHFVMQVLGSVLTIIGTIVRMVDLSYSTFSSAHGVLGFIAMLLTAITLLVTLVNFISCKKLHHTAVAKLHAFLCVLTVGLALIVLALGFSRVELLIGTSNRNIGIALSCLGLFGIVLSPILHSVMACYSY